MPSRSLVSNKTTIFNMQMASPNILFLVAPLITFNQVSLLMAAKIIIFRDSKTINGQMHLRGRDLVVGMEVGVLVVISVEVAEVSAVVALQVSHRVIILISNQLSPTTIEVVVAMAEVEAAEEISIKEVLTISYRAMIIVKVTSFRKLFKYHNKLVF